MNAKVGVHSSIHDFAVSFFSDARCVERSGGPESTVTNWWFCIWDPKVGHCVGIRVKALITGIAKVNYDFRRNWHRRWQEQLQPKASQEYDW